MRNWFRGLKLNQKFTVTTLIFIFIPLFGMMCFGFRSIKKNAIDHGVNEAVTAIDLTCAEVNAKANACSMVVDTLQEYEPLEKYLLHLRRGEEISESYYQQFRNNSISIIDKFREICLPYAWIPRSRQAFLRFDPAVPVHKSSNGNLLFLYRR